MQTHRESQSISHRPWGQLDRAGTQSVKGAGQPIMAQLIHRHQERPLLPQGRDKGSGLPAEKAGGARLPFLMA